MLVSELKGPLLSYWVAKAEGIDVRLEEWMTNPPKPARVWRVISRDPLNNGLKFNFDAGFYNPHENVILAMALLVKHNIVLVPMKYGKNPFQWTAKANEVYTHYIDDELPYSARKHVEGVRAILESDVSGDTPQEAICRAVVAAKFGPEVQA